MHLTICAWLLAIMAYIPDAAEANAEDALTIIIHCRGKQYAFCPACLHHPRLPPNASIEYSVFSTSVPCSPGIPAMPAFVFVSPRVESGIHSASYEKRWWRTARKKLSKWGCESVALARARDPSRGAELVALEVLCLGMKKAALALLRADIRTLVLPAATSV